MHARRSWDIGMITSDDMMAGGGDGEEESKSYRIQHKQQVLSQWILHIEREDVLDAMEQWLKSCCMPVIDSACGLLLFGLFFPQMRSMLRAALELF